MFNNFKEPLLEVQKKARAFSEKIGIKKSNLKIIGLIILGSYIVANLAVSMTLPSLIERVIKSKKDKDPDTTEIASFSESGPNFRDIKKSIMDRNIFNIDGEYPEEKDEDVKPADVKAAFDLNAPCGPTTLKLTLIGTILLGDGTKSLATFRETGSSESDVYTVGDSIWGAEEAHIAAIYRNKVVINNDGLKECFELKLGDEKFMAAIQPELAKKTVTGASIDAEVFTVSLQSSWVESELGDGFGKVIQDARLVPNTVNNRVNGFKIFAIKKESLLDKVGFQDGDVITQVNSIVMEAEQGFALYQAFLDEREIKIQLLRNGTDPKTISVSIK